MMKSLYIPIAITCLGLVGCQALQDNNYCWNQVNQQVPAQTQQRYIRTDTKCNTNDVIATTTKGSQYMGNSTTNCTSTPVYETIVLNQAERDSAYQQCRDNLNNSRAAQQYSQPSTLTYDPNPTRPGGYASPPKPVTANSLSLEFLDCWAGLDKFSTGRDVYTQFLIKNINSANKSELLANKGYLSEIQKGQLGSSFREGMCISSAEKKLTMSQPLQDAFKEFGRSLDITNQKMIAGKVTIALGNQQRLIAMNDFAVKFIKDTGIRDAAWMPSKESTPQNQPSPSNLTSKPMPPQSTASAMERAKQKCIDLGFKTETESFGQCVLKMSK
jgi:hypothetical protein